MCVFDLLGSVWNRMEVNGILSGILAMKLEIGKSFDLSVYEELGASGDRYSNLSALDCAP